MNPNHLVTFDGLVRIQATVRAHGDGAAYFAAGINGHAALTGNPVITGELARRGLTILELVPSALVSVTPIQEGTFHD